MLNVFFTSVFTSKINFQKSEVPQTRVKGWRKENVPLMEDDQGRESIRKLSMRKSKDSDGMQPQLVRELADVVVRPLSIILDQSL